MAIDLLGIQPTVVSRDLKGKLVLFYGDPKSGKTTTATKFPKSLLLAFEKGYNALNNVMAQPINKWAEFKQVLKQLKDPNVQSRFETIIVDTVDIAWDLCEKYILQREGVDKIGDVPFGAGYAMVEKEFDETLRAIPLLDYGLVMISHAEDKEFKDENGQSYQKIVPTVPKRPRKVVTRMVDIIAYSRTVEDEEGNNTVNLYMRGTTRFEAGSRWKHTPSVIPFEYKALTSAIAEAIEKQAEEDGIQATNKHINLYQEQEELSFEELMEKVTDVINELVELDDVNNPPKISKVIEKHLGKGRKLADADEEQIQMVVMILDDLKDLLKK
jgi:hypothetical protein